MIKPGSFFENVGHLVENAMDSFLFTQKWWLFKMECIAKHSDPLMNVLQSFFEMERERLIKGEIGSMLGDIMELGSFTNTLANRSINGTRKSVEEFFTIMTGKYTDAIFAAIRDGNFKHVKKETKAFRRLLKHLLKEHPEAKKDLGDSFGFNLSDKKSYPSIIETSRVVLIQVLPTKEGVEVDYSQYPVLHRHPFVLGRNVLNILPEEDRSYVLNFANAGIPTFVMITKDIQKTEAVQLMTGEDDVLDTAFCCEKVMEITGKKVILCGYCQGGFLAVLSVLSGKLDHLLAGLITAVAPIDGTKNKALAEFVWEIPTRYQKLTLANKTLPNGNKVVCGKTMGWVYKLKGIEKDTPIIAMLNDIMCAYDDAKSGELVIKKSKAALIRWLDEHVDLPIGIVELSLASHMTPIDDFGNLPIKLFGKQLNIKHIETLGIPWQINLANDDTLVDKESILCVLEHLNAEVTMFSKGHVAIGYEHSRPNSKCPLGGTWELEGKKYRGPVKFVLDLDKCEEDFRVAN